MLKNTVFLILLVFALFSNQLNAVVIDEIVATVNGEPVTLAELERILQPVFKRYEQVLKGAELRQAKRQARKELLGN